MTRIHKIGVGMTLLVSVLSGCASRDKGAPEIVLMRFFADQDLGVVIHPVSWTRPADQDNPGADCTLKLEKQGPPENVYSCVVRDAQNVFIVKLHESYTSDLDERHLSKISIDSRWAVTRDMWVEELRKSNFREAARNPLGTKGEKWDFVAPDNSSKVSVFWNSSSSAVSVWVMPGKERE
jgi:hypothetical protein